MIVENLDAMTSEELMSFWLKHRQGCAYLDLFPDGGKNTKRATASLANYASNKATAMRCRERGNVDVALSYEGIADRIYDKLPPFARW